MITRLLDPGEWLDRWLILDRFIGSWGVVYVLRETGVEANGARPEVVIGKTILPYWAQQPQTMARFEHECYNWLNLGEYKHITRLYTVERFQKQAFAIGEYVPQELLPNTLRGWLDAHLVEVEVALRFGIHLCRALGYVRAQGLLTHQDLKPENFMVTPSGVLKVTDWGLSRLAHAGTPAQPMIGNVPYELKPEASSAPSLHYFTPGYAAPELKAAGASATPETDMYSLGVVLAEMLTGSLPAAGLSTEELANCLEGISAQKAAALAQGVLACLSDDPAQRPADPRQIESLLIAAFEESLGVPAEKTPPGSPYRRPTDEAQKAYGLFMLGKLDEANEAMAKSIAQEDGKDKDMVVTMMDYKEDGFKIIVPKKLVDQNEKEWQEDPDNLDKAHTAIGNYYLSGDYAKVIRLCEQVLQKHPNHPETLHMAYSAANGLGQFREAAAYLDRALQAQPGKAEWWLERADLFGEHGNNPEAIRSLKKVIEFDPKNGKAHNRLGHYYTVQGNASEALRHFKEATILDPQEPSAWYNLGSIHAQTNHFEGAVAPLKEALKLEPDLPEALNTLGSVMMNLMRFQEALLYLKHAAEVRPGSPRPWFNMGQCYRLLQDDQRARECYERALEIDPNHALARAALAEMKPQKKGR